MVLFIFLVAVINLGLIQNATEIGANGIVAVRLTTSMLMGGAAEIVAYGTAVVVE